MKQYEAIEYLDKLEVGMFLTVNIPIFKDEVKPVTAMYAGKDKNGRYNFVDTGNFMLSKDFIERGKVTLDKEFNEDEAFDIYSKVKLLQEKKQNKDKNLSR